MHIHILGICGTFMGGIAMIARQAGHTVTGTDAGVYPPMSTQLENEGVKLCEGYKVEHLSDDVDLYIIGNALSRGNEMVEEILAKRLAFQSGPQWLYENVLREKWVLAVSGTHGKTTTSSMLAWILEYANLEPGFLIGGVPQNFGISARLKASPFFVIEADEYDTAFFDKRSKFVHYYPSTLVINNLEFDHADIFKNLDAIKTQFHHVVRLVPNNGKVIINGDETNIQDVIDMGLWSEKEAFSMRTETLEPSIAGAKSGQTASSSGEEKSDWQIIKHNEDCSQFTLQSPQNEQFELKWDIIGQHNMGNAIAAVAAAQHAGVPVKTAIDALKSFKNVKRRMEHLGTVNKVSVYDDFAHHPTAIQTTLEGLRAKVGNEKIIAVLEPRSNTMRMGIHTNQLAQSLTKADEVILFQPKGLDWSLESVANGITSTTYIYSSIKKLVEFLGQASNNPKHVLIMSNGAFGGVHQKLLSRLKK